MEGGWKIIREHRPTILMEVNKPYYYEQGVKLDELFLPLIPERYSIYLKDKGSWKRIYKLEDCSTIDNIFLIPDEKIGLDDYKIFNQAKK